METLCTWVYSVDIFDRPESSAGITVNQHPRAVISAKSWSTRIGHKLNL